MPYLFSYGSNNITQLYKINYDMPNTVPTELTEVCFVGFVSTDSKEFSENLFSFK